MSKYSIGLDLGVNNVGWSIVDIDTAQIEKCGVRRFNTSDSAKDRRFQRNTRRRLKRRDTRKEDLLKLFGKINFPTTNTIDSKLIEKRYKGINEQITKQDIVNILCFLVTHRGYIPFGDEEVEFVDLQGKLPCEYYYDLYKNSINNKYRALRQTVKNTDNEREIRRLIEVQNKYYPELNQEFITSLFGTDNKEGIFNRKRKFWEGPGSINSFTEYGRFNSDDEVKDYLAKKQENPSYEKYLFEDLIGKCSVDPDERCASTGNFYAEKFNLLNDFINIYFKKIEGLSNQQAFYQKDNTSYKLTKEGLDLVFEYCLTHDTITIKKLLKDLFNTTEDNIGGCKTDEKGKPELSTMNIYRSMKKIFAKNNANLDIFKEENIDKYNAIINYMGIVPGIVELVNIINDMVISLSDNDIDALTDALKTNKKNLKYHSLSEKVLKRAINDMQNNCLNYMQVFKKYDYAKKSRNLFIEKYSKFSNNLSVDLLNSEFIDDIIASPQVKKTLRQAIKIINAIIEEKGNLPYSISIESAKETMNGAKKRQEYSKIRDLNTKLHKQAEEYLKSISANVTEKNIEKVMLWNEFSGVCPYCNKSVNINYLLNGSYEIEHILPRSESFDNSYENKTIACADCNKNKGNKTPLQYLNGSAKEAFINRINSNKNISDIKKKNFLYVDDISKYKIRFFNRNLRDTAYATKEIVNQINIFNDYLKYKYNDDTKKILTISTPGQFTSNIRKRYDLEKNRDAGEQPYHHAVDASIIALLPTTELGSEIIEFQNNSKFFLDTNADKKMDNIGYKMNVYYKSESNIEYDNYIIDLKKITDENKELFKYSPEVVKEANRQLSDANIIKVIFKGKDYFQISQINDIYSLSESDKKILDKAFDDSKNETLLCQDNNIKLYNKLKDIYLKFKDSKEPFVDYCREVNNLSKEDNFDYLIHGIKSSENGPTVKKLRYYIPINDPYFLEKKNINKKENTLIALDGLSQVCTRVYYNETKNCFTFLPIPAICTNLKNGKINKNHRLYKQYYDKLIGEDKVRHIVDLYNGNTIEVYKKSGEIIRGEVSYYDKTEKRIVLKKKNNENSPKKFIKNDYKLMVYDIDPLGNEKIRLTFEIK